MDDMFYLFLVSTHSKNNISSLIIELSNMNLINKTINYLSVDKDSNEYLYYLPSSKNGKANNPFKNEFRTKIKIGRLALKLISKNSLFTIKETDIESFVNLFKSFFNNNDKFEIVSGDDINKWYLESNHLCIGDIGSLGKSCMKHEQRNQFMNFYSNNINCSLLILLSEDNKLKGRSLLWKSKDESNNEVLIMDRIYCHFDQDYNKFYKWAEDNKYYRKRSQDAKTQQLFYYNGQNIDLRLYVKYEISSKNKYPFLDTFCFIDFDRKLLLNHPEMTRFHLQNTSGEPVQFR